LSYDNFNIQANYIVLFLTVLKMTYANARVNGLVMVYKETEEKENNDALVIES